MRVRRMHDHFIHALRARLGPDLFDFRLVEREHQIERDQRDLPLAVGEGKDPRLHRVEHALRYAFARAVSGHRNAQRRIQIRLGGAGQKHIGAGCDGTQEEHAYSPERQRAESESTARQTKPPAPSSLLYKGWQTGWGRRFRLPGQFVTPSDAWG